MNIIITGAGKGIGYETAKKLVSMGGNKIIAVSRNLDAWKADQHPNVIPFQLDLLKNNSAEELASFAKENLGTIDILINNAGFLVNKEFLELTEEDLERQLAVNIKAPFLIIKALYPLFKKGSHIVNIGSMSGFQGSSKYAGLSAYSASKAAISALTECLAKEFQEEGIIVNCLALGAVQTEMFKTAFPGYSAPVSPSEMGDFIANFSLYESKYYNGRIIPVSLQIP
jgi:NAD(P)-dependent dehydrogenase (short-subunit alcohol dehydrogenase family)